MVEKDKSRKVEKWKNIKIPESIWRTLKVEAAKKGVSIYKVLEEVLRKYHEL